MVFGELSLGLEPAWPWSIPNIGLPAMAGIALALAGLTVWTYLGVQRATWVRLATVLALRLFALALAFFMVMRPSFGVTHLEGVETSKCLVVFDASESMNVADASGPSTRWEQVNRLWASRAVQRRLDQLADEQKIVVVKYLASEDLQTDEPNASAKGKRTDMGAWLNQLWQKHGHEKRLRGIAVFSDGGDNGTRFPVLEKARLWRGVCPIHTFGAGNPNDSKFGKDVALTALRVVEPAVVSVKSRMKIKAVAQAFGFEKAKMDVSVWLEDVTKKEPQKIKDMPGFVIQKVKNQEIIVTCEAPELPGEYKLTVKIEPLPEEKNKDNNEISTFVQVVKEKIRVLWVDRPRVYEPTFALRYALKPEARFEVRYAEPPTEGKADPVAWYGFDKEHFDVIVIGDISARQFSLGKPEIFRKVKEMVEKHKTGLLMLGGKETFANGGWQDQPAWMELMPVTFEKGEFREEKVRAVPVKEGVKFLELDPDPKKNGEIWNKHFEPLEGLARLGGLADDKSEPLLKGKKNGELVLAARKSGDGWVAVFAGDTTSQAWFGSPEAVRGYQRFWKQLVYRLAQQEAANQLWVNLDKRQIDVGASESLGFTFGLRSKTGDELPDAKFKIKISGPDGPKKQEHTATYSREDLHQRGLFQGVKEPGEYHLEIAGNAQDRDKSEVAGKTSPPIRFFVVSEDVEMLRPAADHELLSKIAGAAEGRFALAEEQALLAYLDELKGHVNSEARLRTTHWPDWKRLPASDRARDQLSGIWHSFALGGFVLFVLAVSAEWFLRCWWGLV